MERPRSAARSKGFCAKSFSPATGFAAEPVMLNDDASSMDFDQVYDARNWTPWLKRFCRLTSSALYEEFAMLAISPMEEKIQLLGESLSVHPEYSLRWLALPEFEIGWPFTYPGTNTAGL